MNYDVVFARSARKELERLEQALSFRILRRIERLSRNPRPDGCRKLQGASNLWRIRIGDYRVLYAVTAESPGLLTSPPNV